jgi:hypothetical protein
VLNTKKNPPVNYHIIPDLSFHFDADPDQTFFHLDADPDQTFHFDADPDQTFFHLDADTNPAVHQSDANLRPLVYRPSTAHSGASTPPL